MSPLANLLENIPPNSFETMPSILSQIETLTPSNTTPFSERENAEYAAPLLSKLKELLETPAPETLSNFYTFFENSLEVGPIVNTLADHIRSTYVTQNSEYMFDLFLIGYWLCANAPHIEAVKFGMVLLGMFDDQDGSRLIKKLGLHVAFCHYAAIAILNASDHPDLEIWELAKEVEGPARAQLKEYLEDSPSEAIKSWLSEE